MDNEAYRKGERVVNFEKKKKKPTIISSRVSRLTLNGIFFMTMAVGMISSSGLTLPGVMEGAGSLI